ncbi:MAG TPA: ATP-binding protein [Candidatus Nitrosotenuis sp.]|nr:ATP-binding protein [Candidatus Nitrosotenuis sp.]
MKLGPYHVQLMRYYDEVLTQSARNYAFTADRKWETRYKAIEPLSDKLLKDAILHADDSVKQFFITMDNANAKLVKMEYRAIELVNEGKPDEAVALLESQEYSKEKKILAEGLENFIVQLEASHAGGDVLANVMIPSVQQIVEIERKMALLEDNVKKEKLFVIGELAARLAHDIRNPLSIIKNAVEMLIVKEGASDPKTLETYMKIQRAVDRISYQIDDVLNFVKPRKISLSRSSLNSILNTVIGRLRIPQTVDIELPENDVDVIADVANLEIVFVNLITNAIQAMNNVGKIKIEACQDGKNVIIKIIDSGPGIPKENLSLIFEPLFTTKQTGTGLGLVSCKTIIEQHGGSIHAESRLGEGATFVVTLPHRQS